MKFKHNKKQNAAFLYEALIKEMAKAVLEENETKKQAVLDLIKESYSRDTLLFKELKLYQAISKTKGTGVITAEKIISEAKKMHATLDDQQLKQEKISLVSKINERFPGDKIMENFIPNYKTLASIHQVFNKDAPIKSRILLENGLLEMMVSAEAKDVDMKPLDNIEFKMFIKKFNEAYSNELFEEQQDLLKKYITSFSNNGLELKSYLSEEISRLKTELNEAKDRDSANFSGDITLVAEELESYKEKDLTQEDIIKVIKIQKLVREIKE